jgi:hypothetical protein
MTQHPITPPPELVQQWSDIALAASGMFEVKMQFATLAARWGADQELEACCEWLGQKVLLQHQSDVVPALRAARRPKPSSLKERAKQALGRFSTNAHINADEMVADFGLLRRAVEQLND